MSRYDSIFYKGKSLMFWALQWFTMTNDTFFDLYEFNFNPHKYPNLYEEARQRLWGEKLL